MCLCSLGDETFKVFPGGGNVHLNDPRRGLRFRGTGHDQHDVCILREGIDVGRKVGVAYFHTLKLGIGLETGYFELLDNVRYALEAMAIILLLTKRRYIGDNNDMYVTLTDSERKG